MKTSTKLLIGLFLMLVVAMFGAGASLRRQYDSIDKTDKYARWKKTSLSPFRAIRISGPTMASVHIESGSTSRLLVDTLDRDWPQLKDQFSAQVTNDTLLLVFKPDPTRLPNSNPDGRRSPSLLIQCPQITGLTTVNANAQLSGFKGTSLVISQQGSRGELHLTDIRVQELTASLSGRNILMIDPGTNQIEQAAITLRDSTQLTHFNDFSKGFTLNAAPGTTVQLTGKALQQIRQ